MVCSQAWAADKEACLRTFFNNSQQVLNSVAVGGISLANLNPKTITTWRKPREEVVGVEELHRSRMRICTESSCEASSKAVMMGSQWRVAT